MQMYEVLNSRKIFNGKKINTYQDAFNNLDLFISDIINKSEEERVVPKDYVLTEEEKNKLDMNHVPEILMLKRKEKNGFTPTKCDDSLMDIIFFSNNETYKTDKYQANRMHDRLKKEIVRLKGVEEKKINYEDFITKITPFHFDFVKESDIKKIENLKSNIKKDFMFLGSEKKNNILDKIIKKKNNIYVEESHLKNIMYISGSMSSGSTVAMLSLLNERMLKNEGSIFFDFTYDKSLSNKINGSMSALGKRSQLIKILPEEFLELSKEQVEYFVKKKKTVLIHSYAILKAPKIASNFIKKTMYVIDVIGNIKKDDSFNIFMNYMDDFIDGEHEESNIFLNSFHHKVNNVYNNTNFILKGESFSDTKVNKNKFISECKVHLMMKSDRTLNALGCMKIPKEYTTEHIRSVITSYLDAGEFIIAKDNKLEYNDTKYQSYYSNLSNQTKSSIDMN